MSTPTPTRPPAPVSPTRQQLDELEALMQRMLALPVHPLEAETEAAPAAPPPLPEPPAWASAAIGAEPVPRQAPQALAVAEPEIPTREQRPVILEQQPEAVEEPPFMEARAASWLQPLPPPTLPFREPAPLPNWTAAAAVLPEPEVETPAEEREPAEEIEGTYQRWRQPALAWWLRPLVGLNLAFDRLAAGCGPLGRLLRSPSGRAFLGWAGLLLLAAALALTALDGMGWTW